MATLIPGIGSCTFDTGGERRLAERLEAKLEDDYLCWYNVPVGQSSMHPDFVILHPRRGLLVLEVKDWRRDTLITIDPTSAVIHADGKAKTVLNPLEQARHYAQALAGALEKDPQLVFSSGCEAGRLRFPWSYGVVLANITRKAFDEGGLGEAMPSQRVICQDEMLESVDVEAFQRRLWQMFKVRFQSALSLPQIDRVRWHLFPEVRIPPRQGTLFGAGDETGHMDLMQVMDLHQEQLARSLGDGHRVIHGVAGSGKTLILGYRAEHLARAAVKPILVLCYNESLAKRLARSMADKGLGAKVRTHHFHQWCRAQLVAYNAGLPATNDDKDAFFEEMVERVIRSVERGLIPAAQYDAILIDEGHDFRPEWFKLVVQMVDPKSNSLLVLYDDAQSIYGDARRKKFSFKRVGIQAQGRTTILKVNYRNTDEILRFARDVAQGILKAQDADDDGVPLIRPQSAGRAGPPPQVVRLPTLKDEAGFIVQCLKDAHRNGTPWRDMAVIYRHYNPVGKTVLATLRSFGVPVTYFKDATFAPAEDAVLAVTMHSCKGLEFPLVLIPGADRIQGAADLPPEEAKLLYVAMTRATRELVVSGVADSDGVA
ncbi:MAG: NERD domain-containing protein [Rhodocyclales bacterium]|nr:NERD domain-containing protein [Rhodocyclales bacterium]